MFSDLRRDHKPKNDKDNDIFLCFIVYSDFYAYYNIWSFQNSVIQGEKAFLLSLQLLKASSKALRVLNNLFKVMKLASDTSGLGDETLVPYLLCANATSCLL